MLYHKIEIRCKNQFIVRSNGSQQKQKDKSVNKCPKTTVHNAEGTLLTKNNLWKISSVIQCEPNLRAMLYTEVQFKLSFLLKHSKNSKMNCENIFTYIGMFESDSSYDVYKQNPQHKWLWWFPNVSITYTRVV